MTTTVGDSVVLPSEVFHCFGFPHTPYEALHCILELSCSRTNLHVILLDDVIKLTYSLVAAVKKQH